MADEPAIPSTTPPAAAPPAAAEGQTTPSAPAAEPKPTLLGDAARSDTAPDPAKNADGTPKTPEQLEAEKAASDPTKNADGTPKTPEQLEADKKAADEKAAKEKEAKGAPEKYEAFKLPEGVTIPEKALTDFNTLAKESNLSQEKAQKFIDAATAHTADVVKQMQDGQTKAWDGVRDKWVGEVQADPEVGGANLNKSKELAFRAVKAFGGTDAERQRLITEVFDAGFGDHPLFFKMMTRIGTKISSDTFVEGSKPLADAEQSAAKKLYPSHN